jgi:hypothetical protein
LSTNWNVVNGNVTAVYLALAAVESDVASLA